MASSTGGVPTPKEESSMYLLNALRRLWFEKLTHSLLGTTRVLQRHWLGFVGTFIGHRCLLTATSIVLLGLSALDGRVRVAKRKLSSRILLLLTTLWIW